MSIICKSPTNFFFFFQIKMLLNGLKGLYLQPLDFQYAMCIPEFCQGMESRSNSILFKELGLTTISGTNGFGMPVTTMTKTMSNLRPIGNNNFDENKPPSQENPAVLSIYDCIGNADTDAKKVQCETYVGKDTYSFGIM